MRSIDGSQLPIRSNVGVLKLNLYLLTTDLWQGRLFLFEDTQTSGDNREEWDKPKTEEIGVIVMMNKLNMKKLVAVLVAAVAILTLMVAPAFATEPDGTAQVAITGGTLSGGVIGFADFASIELDGMAKTSDATWTIGNVVDARGTGAGWSVSLTLAQLKEWDIDDYVTGGAALDTSSVTVKTAPAIEALDSSSSDAAAIAVVATDIALDTGLGVKLVTSDLSEGMGSYSVSNMTVTLHVPAKALAHTYKTDATVALTVGP